MLHLKRIYKSILRYKTSSILTLLSLIISFTGIIILTLYVSFEESFDSFHENKSSIYRLETRLDGSWLPAIMSEEIKTNIPEVESSTPIWDYKMPVSTSELQKSNTKFDSDIIFANESFFDIFSFPLRVGDKETVLKEPHSAVISEELSQKLFSNNNAIGQSIIINKTLYVIKGVMENFPKNSSLQGDCILSFSTYLEEEKYSFFTDWYEWSFSNYLKLTPTSDPQKVAAKIEALPKIDEVIAEERNEYSGNDTYMVLRPVDKIHFFSDDSVSYINPVVLNIFKILMIILAIMGAVNFINFSTSQAPLRAKSLSVIRVVGGKKLASMVQIITESVILSIAAMIISLSIYEIMNGPLESLFNIEGLKLNGRYIFLLVFLLLAIVFGIIAGLYPSRYISSPPIAQTVKGDIHFSGKGKTFRNSLIVLQFIFTIALISSAFTIEKQLKFWRNFDIGINKEHVVFLRTTEALQNHYQAFANELLNDQNIKDYTYSQFLPGHVGMGWGRDTEDGQYIQFKCWPVDDRFFDFFDIELADGRKFLEGSKADINSFILNEKAVEKFGWKDPLTRDIKGFEENGKIIGIAENFNFSSLKDDITPLAFWLTEDRKNILMLRVSPGNYTQTKTYIENTAHKFDPKNKFEVMFLEDALNEQYAKEETMAHFIEFVTLWCFLLSVTGMLGLIIFISRDRIKEIGIRKVNGAKVSEVILMLNKDFVKWVAIAIIVATPLAWFAMNKWLENFTYKTNLNWWIFALAGLFALTIATITVSWQSWKAANRNPVEALRYE